MVVIEMKGSYSNALTDIYPNHLEVYVLDIVIQITIICMYLFIAQLGSFICMAWMLVHHLDINIYRACMV